jgi:hypothetical protein
MPENRQKREYSTKRFYPCLLCTSGDAIDFGIAHGARASSTTVFESHE